MLLSSTYEIRRGCSAAFPRCVLRTWKSIQEDFYVCCTCFSSPFTITLGLFCTFCLCFNTVSQLLLLQTQLSKSMINLLTTKLVVINFFYEKLFTRVFYCLSVFAKKKKCLFNCQDEKAAKKPATAARSLGFQLWTVARPFRRPANDNVLKGL